jgi:asparagine synthase (glutamine-hydrolysing)
MPLSTSSFLPEDWIRDWVRCTWHLETPVITNPSAIPFAGVAALAHAEGYKAVLTGEGADELFFGYPRLASQGLERLAGAPIQFLRWAYRRVPGLADAILNERDTNSYDFLRGIAGGFEDDALMAAATGAYGFLPPAQASLHARSAVMMQTSLLALLQRNDRMGMSASIESRFPFLGEEVVSFALNLPARHKLRRAPAIHDPKHPFVVDKAPIRAVGERYLTSQAAGLRKSGFPTTGLHSIRVRPGAFVESWSSEAFGAGRDFDREIQSWHQPYDVAKLVSIEIFGRLFGAKESMEQVDEWVAASVEIAH